MAAATIWLPRSARSHAASNTPLGFGYGLGRFQRRRGMAQASKPGQQPLRTCVSHRYASTKKPVLNWAASEKKQIGQTTSPALDNGLPGIGRQTSLHRTWYGGEARACFKRVFTVDFKPCATRAHLSIGAISQVLEAFKSRGPQAFLVCTTPGATGPAIPPPLPTKTSPQKQLRERQPDPMDFSHR